ncbi:MAG: XshC-Cox1 family protein [Streptosporangiales bacterium]|nr:XshC-Cox1 family protein [Streptosporangiales bacterium]
MRDVLDELETLWSAGRPFGMARVVRTWRSAPRAAGATMAVGPDGAAFGSVSGGCVEGAVYELAGRVSETGQPVLQRYGVSDDDAAAVGLTCGGVLDVLVEAVDAESYPEFGAVVESVRTGEPVAVATVIEVDGSGPTAEGEFAGEQPAELGRRLVVWPDRRSGSIGSDRLDDAVTDDVRGMLAAGTTDVLRLGRHGERRADDLMIFVQSMAPKPRMVVFGAIDFAASMARMGSFLGFRVTVCDARGVFATKRRFPDADEVVVEWPHRYLERELHEGTLDQRTVVCVLTHDPKFDVPLLQVALQTPAAYIGAMGSRRTHDDRMARLREAGVAESDLARISSPIGLDVGARTPEETAVSIAAEIVQTRWGGTGARLAQLSGPIHKDATGLTVRADP